MQKKVTTLDKLTIGSFGTVNALGAEGRLRRRFQDLGLISGTSVEALRKSPSGDPMAYQIRGAVIAIRAQDASKIFIEEEIRR